MVTRNSRFLAVGLCAILMLFAAILSAKDDVTVIGTVYPTEWGKCSNVTEAVIISSTGRYRIVDDVAGQALFKLGHRNVKVTGFLGEDAKGDPTVTVIFYETVKE